MVDNGDMEIILDEFAVDAKGDIRATGDNDPWGWSVFQQIQLEYAPLIIMLGVRFDSEEDAPKYQSCKASYDERSYNEFADLGGHDCIRIGSR